jgi:hypothetical protein
MATKQRVKKIFGVKADICAKLWTLCLPLLPQSVSPVHLLWALYFLKQYSTEEVNASFAKCDEKMFRKWCWTIIHILAMLELVSLQFPLSIIANVVLGFVSLGLHVGKHSLFLYDSSQ